MKKTVSFSVSFEDGDVIREYLAVCDVEYSIDKDYGSDADGGRGSERMFIDHVEIIYVLDESGNNVANYNEKFKEAVIEKAGDQL